MDELTRRREGNDVHERAGLKQVILDAILLSTVVVWLLAMVSLLCVPVLRPKAQLLWARHVITAIIGLNWLVFPETRRSLSTLFD